MSIIYTQFIGYIGHCTWPKSGKCKSNGLRFNSKSGYLSQSKSSAYFIFKEEAPTRAKALVLSVKQISYLTFIVDVHKGSVFLDQMAMTASGAEIGRVKSIFIGNVEVGVAHCDKESQYKIIVAHQFNRSINPGDNLLFKD